MTFNRVEDVFSLFTALEVGLTETLELEIVKLGPFFERRHKIVHRADAERRDNESKIADITEVDVTTWLEVVDRVVRGISFILGAREAITLRSVVTGESKS
jgi:hypothetical protein